MIKNVLKRRREEAMLFISLLHLESPAMSMGSSQVGASLSPSF